MTLLSVVACGEEESTNALPTVKNPLEDIVLERGFMSTTLDLVDVFEDADGDELNLMALASDTEVITISLDGTVLTISEGTTSGTSTISITAEDANAGAVEEEFSVMVQVVESIST